MFPHPTPHNTRKAQSVLISVTGLYLLAFMARAIAPIHLRSIDFLAARNDTRLPHSRISTRGSTNYCAIEEQLAVRGPCPRGARRQSVDTDHGVLVFLIELFSAYLVGMRCGNKDNGTLLGHFVGTTRSNLPKEDIKQESEEEVDKVIDLETHGLKMRSAKDEGEGRGVKGRNHE